MYNYPNYNYGYMPQQSQNFQQQTQVFQPQTPTLNGKVVDSIDVARNQEIPIGGYGIYPQADGMAIYYKHYNVDGTTSLEEFKKVASKLNTNSSDASLNDIVKMIEELSSKVDALQKPNNQIRNKKEVSQNE